MCSILTHSLLLVLLLLHVLLASGLPDLVSLLEAANFLDGDKTIKLLLLQACTEVTAIHVRAIVAGAQRSALLLKFANLFERCAIL